MEVSTNSKFEHVRVEFRVKQKGVQWELIAPIDIELYVPADDKVNAINQIAEGWAISNNAQVRWNFYGYMQANYTRFM